jgi:hypothetical protein
MCAFSCLRLIFKNEAPDPSKGITKALTSP